MQPDDIILKYFIRMLRSQGGAVNMTFRLRNRNGISINDKESVKRKWTEHFDYVSNLHKVTGNNIEKNKKFCEEQENCGNL